VMQWAARPGDRTDVIMRLVGTTARLWDRVGLLAEGRSYIDQAIALIRESTPSEVGGRILAHAGLLWHHSDRPRALNLLERAVSFYSRTEQKEGLPFVLCTIGGILAVNGDAEGSSEALSAAEEILALFDLPKSTCILRINQGIWASVKGDRVAALTYFSAAFELCRSPINASRMGFASLNLAELELELGEIDQAAMPWSRSGDEL
jgi:tetratricopeptide (TPR) repeat protein